MKAIEINNLTKDFKDVRALDNISLSVEEGEFLTLLGENGAGKSTLIKIICGILNKTQGDIKVLGLDLETESEKISEFLNVSPQETAVSNNLSVKENLNLICDIYGLRDKEQKIENIIKKLKLESVINKKAKTLSGGYQRRLSIALALITEPKILFLDEPTLGLDVKIRRELWKVITDLKGKITVILTTHYLEEAEEIADRVVIMEKGKIICDGTTDEIKAKAGKDKLEDAFLTLIGADV